MPLQRKKAGAAKVAKHRFSRSTIPRLATSLPDRAKKPLHGTMGHVARRGFPQLGIQVHLVAPLAFWFARLLRLQQSAVWAVIVEPNL